MDGTGSLLARPIAYCNVEGAGELSIGFTCLSYGLLGWQQVRSPESSFWNGPLTFWLYFAVVMTIVHYGPKAIKERITFPRTGKVVYRKRDTVWRPMIVSFIFSVLASVTLIVFLRRHWDPTALVSLACLVLAATYARGFAKAVRWKWTLVGAMSLVAIAIATLPADLVGAMARGSWITARVPGKVVGAVWLALTSYGAMLTVSGAISLWLYLQRTEAPEPEER